MKTTNENPAELALTNRIAAAFGDEATTSNELSDLAFEADETAERLALVATELEAAANNPRLTSLEARKARTIAEDARHEADRLPKIVEGLWPEIDRRNALEKAAAAKVEYAAAQAEQLRVVALINERAPDLIAELREIAREIVACDGQAARANKNLPERARPLNGTEGMARGFLDKPDEEMPRDTRVFRITQMILPALWAEDGVAWPPRTDFGRDIAPKRRLFSISAVRRA